MLNPPPIHIVPGNPRKDVSGITIYVYLDKQL